MSAILQCVRCGGEMTTSSFTGLCTACALGSTDSALPHSGAVAGEAFRAGMSVGPNGRFVLLRKIGQGGMGVVWAAEDREIDADEATVPVALKFLSEGIQNDPKALQLFRREVRRAQSLNHPHIVRVHDLHTTPEGVPFIKMELVDGESLAHWLERSGPMPWRMVCALGKQIAMALDAAHNANLVHRDVKPSNILLAPGQIVKLSDFGIAQALQQFGDSPIEVQPMGSLAYASPQQIQGEPPAREDDIYGFGAALFELLTGTPPFQARSTAALTSIIQFNPPESINERLQTLGREERVPHDLESLIGRCLQKTPAHRPPFKKISALLNQLPAGSAEDIPPPKGSAAIIREVALWTLLAATLLAGGYVARTRWTAAPPSTRARANDPPPDASTNSDASPRPFIADASPPPPSPAVVENDPPRGRTPAFKGRKDVRISSKPADAIVLWDPPTETGSSDRARGSTRKFWAERPYKFRFLKPGFTEWSREVQFTGTQLEEVEAVLEPSRTPQFAELLSTELWTNSLGMVFRLIGPLYVATTETTVEQFRAFAAESPDSANSSRLNDMLSNTAHGRKKVGKSWAEPGFPQSDEHPVVGVSFRDAQQFCEWLSAREQTSTPGIAASQSYRLPTKAEWLSWAGIYPWGDQPEIQGNFSGLEVREGTGDLAWPYQFPVLDRRDPWIRTAPVRAPGASTNRGLFFLAGNVAEHCAEGFVGGGSWFDGEATPIIPALQTLQTANLFEKVGPADRDDRFGFRVVLAEAPRN